MDIQLQTTWPFLALTISLAVGLPLLLQPGSSLLRLRNDYQWLMTLALPLYTLHQFEEYGIDIYGRHYQFYKDACGHLGYTDLEACTIRPWHLGLVNAIFVNGAAVRARYAVVGPGANFYGLAIINGIIHLLNTVVSGMTGGEVYNAGLITGFAGLLPLGVLALRAMHQKGLLSTARVVRAVVVGVLGNVLLISSMPLRAKGYIGDIGYFVLAGANLFGLQSLDTHS